MRLVGMLLLAGLSTTVLAQELTPVQKEPEQVTEPVQKGEQVQKDEPIQKDEPVQKEEQVQKDEWVPNPTQKTLHDIHIRHRVRRGLFVQRLDRSLCNLAQRWAEHMAARNSMYHSSMGYRENIAWGYNSCEAAMNGWINSSGHYANLMSGTEACGFGAAQSRNGSWYWCSLHGGATTQTEVTSSGGGYSSGSSRSRSLLRPFGGRLRLRR